MFFITCYIILERGHENKNLSTQMLFKGNVISSAVSEIKLTEGLVTLRTH